MDTRAIDMDAVFRWPVNSAWLTLGGTVICAAAHPLHLSPKSLILRRHENSSSRPHAGYDTAKDRAAHLYLGQEREGLFFVPIR
jgi:hypothetical protein